MSESTAKENRRSATPGVGSITRTEFDGLSAAESIDRSISETQDEASALATLIDERIEELRGTYKEGRKVSDINQALEAVMERDSGFLGDIGSTRTMHPDPYSIYSEEDIKGVTQSGRIKLARAKIAEIAVRYQKGKEGDAEMQKHVREMLPTVKRKEAIKEGHEKRALKIIDDMLKIQKDLSEVDASEADAWGAAIRELQHHYEFKSYDEEETEE